MTITTWLSKWVIFSPRRKLRRKRSIMVPSAAHASFRVVIMTVLFGMEARAKMLRNSFNSPSVCLSKYTTFKKLRSCKGKLLTYSGVHFETDHPFSNQDTKKTYPDRIQKTLQHRKSWILVFIISAFIKSYLNKFMIIPRVTQKLR